MKLETARRRLENIHKDSFSARVLESILRDSRNGKVGWFMISEATCIFLFFVYIFTFYSNEKMKGNIWLLVIMLVFFFYMIFLQIFSVIFNRELKLMSLYKARESREALYMAIIKDYNEQLYKNYVRKKETYRHEEIYELTKEMHNAQGIIDEAKKRYEQMLYYGDYSDALKRKLQKDYIDANLYRKKLEHQYSDLIKEVEKERALLTFGKVPFDESEREQLTKEVLEYERKIKKEVNEDLKEKGIKPSDKLISFEKILKEYESEEKRK
ncbi:MAG: hypothetical protein LBB10_02295 [Bifidobacteriaceae bacterium]|jgi:hypothetical protein|nr:hypothetical protein [Bifidobacteriaceae bacterium]